MSQQKVLLKQANTIDEKHNELLEHFHETETVVIPKLETEILELKEKIKSLAYELNLKR